MAKPDTTAKPTNDPQLESRVAALEARMTTAETDILEVDARVTTLEEAEDGGEVEPPPIDPPDPEPEPEALYSDVGEGKHFIRGVEYHQSKFEY